MSARFWALTASWSLFLASSITDFLSVLGMLGPGQHDFVMTVTDTEGNVTSKVVMFEFL
jgi:hypothetical protein